MARSAKLTSIDAVRELRAALAAFGGETASAIDDLDINIRRAVEWIEQDRRQFWENEVRRSLERVGEARAELEKARTYRKVANQTPSCRDERAALEKAKRRAQHAEEVYRELPKWIHRIDQAVRDLVGSKTLLVDWVQGDLPKALSTLNRMSTSLDAYAAATQPTRVSPTAGSTSGTENKNEDEPTDETVENKETNDENMGSTHPGGQIASGDEGSQGG